MRRITIISTLLFLFTIVAQAQITVGGNVYGGGNKGYVGGNTTVTVRAGDIGARDEDETEALKAPKGRVFGGARQADVGGNAFVHVDLGHASGDIIINHVYGGNDIAGTVGFDPKVAKRLPAVLPDTAKDSVDGSWNTFVHFSTRSHKEDGKDVEDDDVPDIYVGQAYGGSNGDYYYAPKEGKYYNVYQSEKDMTLVVQDTVPFTIPDLAKSYLDVHAGTIAHCYGGGNAATVTEKAVICIDNPSRVVTNIVWNGKEMIDDPRQKDMGVHSGLAVVESPNFQIGSVFGGNNKATMRIRPSWHLQSGAVRNLYSGGNRGDMTYENGLVLEIPDTSTLKVDNVFGGCRMADVRPQKWNETTQAYEDVEVIKTETYDSYVLPANLAARTIIAGGDVKNVYGGNDVRGKVYFGNAVGIHTSVRGDVYGGGNGAYAYTDAESYKDDEDYGDFYYDPAELGYQNSIDALNDIRPNAEQVSILVRGKPEKKTVIGGSIYVGGNCATLVADTAHAKYLPDYPLAELKIGSHVIAENVFLGNNGEKMVDEDILKRYASEFSSMTFAGDPTLFAQYMSGVTMSHVPKMIAEDTSKGDRMDYEDYTSYIGSLFYGGNRGSMTYTGPINIAPAVPLTIYDKLVAGCNDANVAETDYNARYEGGILGDEDEQKEGGYEEGGKIRDRIVMDLTKIRVQPLRLNTARTALEWNTINLIQGEYVPEYLDRDSLLTEVDQDATDWDKSRRLLGGNIYGGCNESGHINGNVIININDSLHNRRAIFDAFRGEEDGDDILYEPEDFYLTKRNSGVILNLQGMDVLGSALNVFGGGKGSETQIWGSTTVNVTKGYTFQVFGGSESGVIGKGEWSSELNKYVYPDEADARYSTTVNLNSARQGEKRSPENTSPDIADLEFIYAGSFEGLILGNTRVNLDNGRLFNAWGGSCNADILGHAETIIGEKGFVYMRDHVYGGNDLGGQIKSIANFTDSVHAGTRRLVHATDLVDGEGNDTRRGDGIKDVVQANTYVEYRKGSMKDIFGGCFGDYDYAKEFRGTPIPYLNNAFVNIRPVESTANHIDKIFGAGEGYPGSRLGDSMQDRSYVLIDIPDNMENFSNTEVFGSGDNNGLGMRPTPSETLASGYNLDKVSSIIDLAHGRISAVYGGSYNEGFTRRTVVNIPDSSTIHIDNIFGGAYGTQILPPCDVYESNVNYVNTGQKARVKEAIYGGNNKVRRTLYSHVNIKSPVWKSDEELGKVYGAGRGVDTWSEYTEVNLESGAMVDEVYGGGEMGHVLNAESVEKYMQLYKNKPSPQISTQDPKWNNAEKWTGDIGSSSIKSDYAAKWREDWEDAWAIGAYYVPDTAHYNDYAANANTNLSRVSERSEVDDRTATMLSGKKFNTNVIIKKGATVTGYAYGGGWGEANVAMSGDVYGNTYIALLGGTVNKDIYAAGTAGGVNDLFGAATFTASANAFIQGGTVRNVFGGGWRGSVGAHTGHINNAEANAYDVHGRTNVVIGQLGVDDFYTGNPAIKRNVYGGGEGGGIYGTANVYLNNGYIGYRYTKATTRGAQDDYVPELHDKTEGDSLLLRGGNIFGGGYVANSYVDSTDVRMYGGVVRGSLHGGGEIGPVGRGTMADTATTAHGGLKYQGATIYKAGKTRVRLYDGWVKRNVYGGGRGYDNWNGEGYMTDEEKLTVDRSAKGYVFGQTEVNIYGGEVGTVEGLAQGYGNVFGGGDVGFVHSAYENAQGLLCLGKKQDNASDDEDYYYKNENGTFITSNDEKILTEDCKVLIEPWSKVQSQVEIGDSTFAAGTYVPTSYLNLLGNKNDALWENLRKSDINKEGIIIHNAVFAGGNTSPGSTAVHANTTTVFGNATASIHDVYHRDLITIGTGRTGGLYGDGNLTLVDGYRELNVTNYGTDYYSISPEITYAQFEALPDREAAYYELRYKCAIPCKDKNGKNYSKGSTITADEMITAFETVKVPKYNVEYEEDGTTVKLDNDGYPVSTQVTPADSVFMLLADGVTPQPAYWIENGVCSRYAGRILNTIQRADFCGVYGSRMVMQGARDRVPETVDYTNYTINRVGEVSLNKKLSLRTEDAGDDRNRQHGNYFGIYNTVNFLGALTSDVDFGDGGTTTVKGAVRTTDNDDATTYKCKAKPGYATDSIAYGTATYYDWKAAYHNDRRRNNGNSYNKVALASGVYLELTTEKSQGDSLRGKDWGYITGVVELDLINVQPGIGGGFVYAKNVHGKRHTTGLKQLTLTTLNSNAVTRKKYTYDTSDADKVEWQTSGNFIHSTQTIIDDCYNISGKYKGTDAVPAHYWYIKGSVYVYDQYISAYTGSPNAFSEVVNIPLTITSASHGKMTLLDVMPNRYAYYSGVSKQKLGADEELVLRDVSYKLNDPISYWDFFLLSDAEKELFVEKTYVNCVDMKIDGGDSLYAAGTYVMSQDELSRFGTNHTYFDASGDTIHDANKQAATTDYIFRLSNNIGHDTGYILTYNVNNPGKWGPWYTQKNADVKNQTGGENYVHGPSYKANESGLYGQQEYRVGNIISSSIHNTYETAVSNMTTAELPDSQATFRPAYIVTADILETKNKKQTEQRFHKGAMLVQDDYDASAWETMEASVAPAYVVTSTIQLSETEFIYRGTYMTEAEKNKYKSDYADLADNIDKSIVAAYYCTKAGYYGGDYYEQGKNYRATEAFSGLSEEERNKFTFNYDALDLLIDPTYSRAEGVKYQYDGYGFTTPEQAATNIATYSLPTPIDYTATFKETANLKQLRYIDDNKQPQTATDGTVLTRTEYERLLNERYHYAPISVKQTTIEVEGQSQPYVYYVVNKTLILGDTPYAAGQVIDKNTYNGLSDNDKLNVTQLTFDQTGTYFFCREGYRIDSVRGNQVTDYYKDKNNNTVVYNKKDSVYAGTVITEENYKDLVNDQANFIIHGMAPTETSTLYVTRNSDIRDLMTERIITVIYQYDYVETDLGGQNITPVSERHVLNIHIQFKSGAPTVEDILPPALILPGTTITINEPFVTPGAYEVNGGGWELFADETDAESHVNGIEYTPNEDPLYLYQNKYLVAYYAKTYLGKTYSNAVPVNVANYHDLKKVMNDSIHHYYIDHQDVISKGIEPKIYINDYSNDKTGSTSGLSLLKDLYDISTGNVPEHVTRLNSRVEGAQNLEFFLRTDLAYTAPTGSPAWTPIGDNNQCFAGTFHGDGHTISGLDASLFGDLCGDVYNLGVVGPFTSAGIADSGTGYVENTWVYSNNTTQEKTKMPVFGSPSRTDNSIQIVNSYYMENDNLSADKRYTNHSAASGYGIPTRKDEYAFNNGEVAYNLNGFYLHKRYADAKNDKTDHPALSSPGYVESRFADGDFIYADGVIPEGADERYNTDSLKYFPIWPDDYIFFGQALNYGYAEGLSHDSVPTAVKRADNHIVTDISGNRVFRAPAYFRNDTMSVAHFNPYAFFAQAVNGKPKKYAYKDMTAIDFTGSNGDLEGGYRLGWQHSRSGDNPAVANNAYELFYPPMLDDGGLTGFRNIDLTKNLLAYTTTNGPDKAASQQTDSVVGSYLQEPAFTQTNSAYRTVAYQSPNDIHGHWVHNEVSPRDQLLVDRQDFNAPIAYRMGAGKRMWYQREPDNFVDRKKGWEAISLPFSAELVTTDTKGEITHFYSGSEESKNDTQTKLGHEYWLRELKDGSTLTPLENDENTLTALFNYPTAGDGSAVTKEVTNTFLWDYYYKGVAGGHNHKDFNTDDYQEYYRKSRKFNNYPLLANGKPYLIGFPGVTYYEFDLSGQFEATTTAETKPVKISAQTITFASNPGTAIAVSDQETKIVKAKKGSVTYALKANYLNMNSKHGSTFYTLNGNGSAYEENTSADDETVLADAFRPYFTTVADESRRTRSIVFSGGPAEIDIPHETHKAGDTGTLAIYPGRRCVIVESSLRYETEVRIVTLSGVTLSTFTVKPGETVETRVNTAGVYIVQSADGEYTKKLAVR